MASPLINESERFEQIESCNSLWIFDTEEKRFLRLPRTGPRPTSISMYPDGTWESYKTLTIDPVGGEFIVRLNESGSRMLRSQRHGNPCPLCVEEPGSQMTTEFREIQGGGA